MHVFWTRDIVGDRLGVISPRSADGPRLRGIGAGGEASIERRTVHAELLGDLPR